MKQSGGGPAVAPLGTGGVGRLHSGFASAGVGRSRPLASTNLTVTVTASPGFAWVS